MPVQATSMMTAKVRCFAQLRDRLGRSELSLSLPARATARELVRMLRERYPDAAAWLAVSRLAVNCEFVSDEVVLRDGDEVAIIPPVSGG